jgi:N-acetylglutamate synthase-like GNAT family acetyltransferase
VITIRPSTPEEVPQQKELWKRCFGDSSTYVDNFYRRICTPDQVLVVEEDGEINSMAAMLPTTFALPDGQSVPVGYVYALATNPYIQGKGHARQLLRYADDYLQSKGMKALTLVPASPSLHRFFEAVGLEECFATRKIEVMASSLTGEVGDGTLTPILPQEYNRIREECLAGTLHIRYPDSLIQLQQFGSHLSNGDLYRLDIGGSVGCVAIEYVQSRRLLMKELLIAPEKMAQAVELIASQLPATRYHVRTPALWDGLHGSYVQAFGMIKWYDQELKTKWHTSTQEAYLGLGFD